MRISVIRIAFRQTIVRDGPFFYCNYWRTNTIVPP
jgi:hypothetical protein